MIINDLHDVEVSPRVSMMLKEKGFEAETYSYYLDSSDDPSIAPELRITNKWRNWNEGEDAYSAPTHFLALKWINKNFGIWIEVNHITTSGIRRFHVTIWDYKDTEDYQTIHCENGVGYKVWDTPEEALDAALEYSIEKLIK